MSNASTVVQIPLYPGVRGNILDYPSTKNGTDITSKINWITPLEVQYPDGWAIFKIKTVPTLHAYRDHIEFEMWDQYMMSRPRFIGRVKINCNDGSYVVELEQRYHCSRLTLLLTIYHSPQEPFYTNAFRNRTPYGEWRFKDVI